MEIETLFLVLSVSMLFPSPTFHQNNHNVSIHDYTLDNEMIDTCLKVNYTEYCHDLGSCKAGTHVMCMYYKTGMVMGPLCESGKMFRMDQGIRNIIISAIKVIREEVLDGTARGKDDVLLPRAYGLRRRLLWDNDLATFAQVWTNQCQRAHDFCRDTKQFTNVDQFVGVDIFTHKEWRNIRSKNKLEEIAKQCLTRSKVKQAIEYMFKLMRDEDKEHTTESMILNYQGERNKYLMLLNHNTSHIGCGMSYYLEYKWLEDMQKHDVFVLQMVCNLSHRPIIGKAIYNTTRPHNFDENQYDRIDSNSDTEGGQQESVLNLVHGSRGPGVLVMPIITVEDAPPSLLQQPPRKSNLKRTPLSSRKSSIFSRVPVFNLPSRSHNNTSKVNPEDKVPLKNKFKTLLEQVPRKDVAALRELLKQIVKKRKSEKKQVSRTGPVIKKHKSEENPVSRTGPVERPKVSKVQELISPDNANHDADEEISRRSKGEFEESNHGHGVVIETGVVNYPDDDIVNIKDEDLNSQTPFHIPIIRKQKPIVHNQLNSFNDKTVLSSSPVKMQENDNMIKSDILIVNHVEDTTNTKNNNEKQAVIYPEELKHNNHKLIASDDIKLKRRLYLENEVTKLKRKLQHLRQYIRQNDVNDNARIRPVVSSHNGQRTTKFDERRNFYMPDRAHPLHEF